MREQLEALERKWREDAERVRRDPESFCNAKLEGYTETLDECADELRTVLDGCVGEVELPVGEVSHGFSGSQRAVNLFGPVRCQPKPGTKLYTHPPAVVVDEAMVERAYAAWPVGTAQLRDNLRAALTAAIQRDRQP